ncbi:MAG: hypothetical protein SLAVMIC_00509 [uncultured marine phage]|uniref:Uncharacterized protein n=1 Tax=uncultured marine phage TaxID=707152 RepID=A0A8D9FQA1_9VIRU|nr:MAG: hypothetical protein SLAVMIC_00509 [uncultured marine phage]
MRSKIKNIDVRVWIMIGYVIILEILSILDYHYDLPMM